MNKSISADPNRRSHLDDITIGIVGCGGLGSNVAMMLTRVGISKFIIADFDKVVASNLNRQFFFYRDIGSYKVDAIERNLKEINSSIDIEKHYIRISKENFHSIYSKANIIVEAVDSADVKCKLIKIFMKLNYNGKFLISVSGLGGYESSNLIKTVRFSDNIYICGDFKSDSSKYGVFAPRVILAAAHQANMVVRIVNRIFAP